jgi:hypothetical protein
LLPEKLADRLGFVLYYLAVTQSGGYLEAQREAITVPFGGFARVAVLDDVITP